MERLCRDCIYYESTFQPNVGLVNRCHLHGHSRVNEDMPACHDMLTAEEQHAKQRKEHKLVFALGWFLDRCILTILSVLWCIFWLPLSWGGGRWFHPKYREFREFTSAWVAIYDGYRGDLFPGFAEIFITAAIYFGCAFLLTMCWLSWSWTLGVVVGLIIIQCGSFCVKEYRRMK